LSSDLGTSTGCLMSVRQGQL
jgi:hypothetical protein